MATPPRPDASVAPHEPTLNHLRNAVVGPITVCSPPNADAAARMINAWHVVDTYLRPGAQLVVLGDTSWWPDPRITELVRALALPNVWLHEPPDASVRAAFLTAAAVVVDLDASGPVLTAADGRSLRLPARTGASLLAEAVASFTATGGQP